MDDQSIIAAIVGAASVFCGFLVTVIIIMVIRASNKKITAENLSQKLAFEKTVEAETAQKEQIFRNMHDQVNPMLRFVVRNLQVYQKKVEKNELKPEELDGDIDMLLTALNDIRSCTHELVPLYMLDYGLIKGLEALANKLCEGAGIKLSFENNGQDKYLNQLDQNRQINIYRMVLTLLENIIEHAAASAISIQISDTSSATKIELTHNGQGISEEEVEAEIMKNKGFGLQSARARALLVNARINYYITPRSSVQIVLKHS